MSQSIILPRSSSRKSRRGSTSRTSCGDPFDPRLWSFPPVRIPLDNFETLWSLVDAEDALYVRQWMWSAHYDQRGKLYVRRQEGKLQPRFIYLHRVIAERAYGVDSTRPLVDHLNDNGLDNRRHNLRWVNRSENATNKSGLAAIAALVEANL